MSLSTVLAKALFDNAAESPEELAFRKGDILMVLDQEQEGGPGWWLCSLHGRQGIAPANRLRLLQTTQTPTSSTCTETRQAPSVDSVHASPSQLSHVNGLSTEDSDGVYLCPPSLADGVYQSPGVAPAPVRSGELCHSDEGRPRSHSSSGTRPHTDWGDMSVSGRPRSPSLRGRGGESGALYQTPTSPAPLAAQHRSQDALASDSMYLTPSAVPRSAAETAGEARYLTPRDAGAGHSDGCYLVPRPAVTVLTNENLYQTPMSGAPVAGQCVPGMTSRLTDGITPKSSPSSQCKTGQDTPGMYQTPTPPGGAISRTPQAERKHPSGTVGVSTVLTPGQNLKQIPPSARGSPKPQGTHLTPVGGGKLPQAGMRESPLLTRTGKSGVPGSPNFGRKPPAPAPPVRSVTRKDLINSSPIPATKPGHHANLAPPQTSMLEVERQGCKNGQAQMGEMKNNTVTKKECANSHDEKLSDEVYDTPTTKSWQHPVPTVPSEEDDDGIYNTPRTVPQHTDQASEIYDVPTLALNSSSDHQQQTYSIPGSPAVGEDAEEEDVYSVPSLPGLPLEASEMPELTAETAVNGRAYSISSPRKQDSTSEGVSEPDRGIYDMPALTLEIPTCRLSVSSTSSADIQWKASLFALVQSALASASLSTTPSRDLAAALAEILSVWKAGHVGDVSPVLQQAWSRLSDLLPALSVCGTASPADGLLTMVRCALEDSTSLLQSQTRPRLPSQESLSRRPLPALPVAEVKPIAGDMGSRKGSWIQERPLPPPPPAAFPLHPTPVCLAPTMGRVEDEEQGNEYAGIGLTPTPPPSYPVGDSVGYVKLQGKPEPPPDTQTEHSSSPLITTTDNKLSPPAPVPVSLTLEDSELLSFYSSQSLSHLSCLADAIDSLFTSVQGNQPPRVFVSRGKSLIVTAHKLVFIGDTLGRLLSSSDLRAKVTTSSGRLCQALKAVVVATKGAAQNYPSVPATQEMVDRVADLSQHAAGFSGLLQRLAEIS
ncbi:embryonal Fyn-associated substrate-like [Myxocyprinus asiaticus]|uniref:embryonal Fyn-associated substrate-like n=1 Tax=Myxocyprinus asiaticus TaxID=70543 RepID=UPI002222D329|nr:embryonal Fyn-associated substrate-like [Myxocyprinus asiaticus]XP_051570292.1 embryonal Fyn-associated substrate-like [Myxocyprinus asiaticus]